MTGQELFHALSFVDERYIMEAEEARFRKIPWMKYLSVAACLCILVSGMLIGLQMGTKSADVAAPAAQAPEATHAAAAVGTPLAPEEELFTDTMEAAASGMTDEPQQISYAKLRVVQVREDGSFLAEITELSQDPTPLEVGMEVTVVVDPSKVPGADGTAAAPGAVQDALVEIESGAYIPAEKVLYIAGFSASEGEQ